MSDPLHTLEDMDEYSGSMGSDADVAALASIVGEVEGAAAVVRAGQVAEVRALAAAGPLAARPHRSWREWCAMPRQAEAQVELKFTAAAQDRGVTEAPAQQGQ